MPQCNAIQSKISSEEYSHIFGSVKQQLVYIKKMLVPNWLNFLTVGEIMDKILIYLKEIR